MAILINFKTATFGYCVLRFTGSYFWLFWQITIRQGPGAQIAAGWKDRKRPKLSLKKPYWAILYPPTSDQHKFLRRLSFVATYG